MTRTLRKNGKPGYPENSANGRYYEHLQIPVARLNGDKKALMERHKGNREIEALVHGDLILPHQTEIFCYSSPDTEIARHVLLKARAEWNVSIVPPAGPYPRKSEYVNAVTSFIERAHSDAEWRGDGLDFDKVWRGPPRPRE